MVSSTWQRCGEGLEACHACKAFRTYTRKSLQDCSGCLGDCCGLWTSSTLLTTFLGGGSFQIFLELFTPKIGEDDPILTDIFFNWVGEKPPTTVGLQRQTDAPNLMELWKQQDELILFDETEVVSLSTRLATTWSVPQWMAENWLCQFGAMEAWCLFFFRNNISSCFVFSVSFLTSSSPNKKNRQSTIFKML